MTTASQTKQKTLIEALQASLAVSLRTPEGVAEPAVLLWTDTDGQWQGLLPALSAALPQLFILGGYNPEKRTGPVIWLKCILDRTIPEVSPPDGVIPIFYLPGVSRQELRAGGDCPRDLQPLIELQYRGAVWHQRNGRDWTVEAFLISDIGLGLDMAQDTRTREAMLRALPRLATHPIEALRGRRLEAEDFDRIIIGDPVSDLLKWMSAPELFQRSCEPAAWQTFGDVCIREFGFDPDKDGPVAAGDALMHGGGVWDSVWSRFCESPRLYPGVSQLLRGPARDLFVDQSRRPAANEEQEAALRKELEQVLSLPHQDACAKVIALNEKNKERRDWVWAKLGESPFAVALEPLSLLGRAARTQLGGASAHAMAADYAANGFRCDRAVLDALMMSKATPEGQLVSKVVRALYEPWLDQSARHFQSLVEQTLSAGGKLAVGVSRESGTCILFVDGIRYDIAGMIQERLEGRGFRVQMGHRFAPLPTVTATAKPLAAPVHDSCKGGTDVSDFTPVWETGKQQVTAQRLRDEMARQGFDVMDQQEVYMPSSFENSGWAETGKLDELGHSLDCRMVQHIDSEVEDVVSRVAGLIAAGWPRVRIVTDHGWLLVPGGLPKVELPPSLVASKWARCATVLGESQPDVPVFPWHWNPHLRIASPPGIGSFRAGVEYAHGGVSLQECVIPDMQVEAGMQAVRASITGIQWRGMRCKVTVDTNATGLSVDLRLNWRQADSSIAASAKEISSNGEGSLAVKDDSYEGAAAMVVVYDKAGQIIDYKPTTVGEEL
ncbi:MAG: BREX-1 system phosphatase PglZ type B [Geobacter sp.]|nr:BREX-1 system phosphatase PglZ type B [Geobacter sp.]